MQHVTTRLGGALAAMRISTAERMLKGRFRFGAFLAVSYAIAVVIVAAPAAEPQGSRREVE